MVIDFYNRNGGGGGTADYATLAGESNKSKLLEGASTPPQSANTGDVVAIAPNPTRGLRSARTLGIYQYDGTNWNKIEGESSSAYKIELTEVNPQNYTQQDIDTINAFCAAFTANTSIADSAYISALNGIYRCVMYIAIPHSPIFTFEGPYNNNIVDISLIFTNDLFSYGGLQNAVPTPPIPETTSLKPAADFPENPVEGEVMIRSEETLIDYRPEAPDGQTVYGGNLEEFMVTLKGTSNNELWVKTWDDAGHTERTDQGYFHLENDAIDYYDYQGDMDYLFNDLNEGEWADANTIYLLKEGNNLYFYVKQEAEGVFFPDTDATMVFDTMAFENLVNQYDNGEWRIFPNVLNFSCDFPKNAGFGDVVGLGKIEDREATSADVFTSATVTMVNGRATFKMYNPNYSGYCEDYTFGYDVNEGIIGGWGGENNVINGPWSNQGVEFTIDGDDITFTTQNPENTSEALQMWGFDPNCNDRIVIKELGIYQKDEEGWNRAVTSNSINSIVKLTQAEYDTLVSGGTVDANTFYVIISPNS